MYEYRVTKYDPAKRDHRGAYLADEWIFYAQIGETFNGVVFTADQYQATEDAYVAAAIAFVKESGGDCLKVTYLENKKGHKEASFDLHQGVTLNATEIEHVCRLNLREAIWCKLEDDAGRFIHFGWDYYMFVGVPTACEGAKALAHELGLFVEEFESPCRDSETA